MASWRKHRIGMSDIDYSYRIHFSDVNIRNESLTRISELHVRRSYQNPTCVSYVHTWLDIQICIKDILIYRAQHQWQIPERDQSLHQIPGAHQEQQHTPSILFPQYRPTPWIAGPNIWSNCIPRTTKTKCKAEHNPRNNIAHKNHTHWSTTHNRPNATPTSEQATILNTPPTTKSLIPPITIPTQPTRERAQLHIRQTHNRCVHVFLYSIRKWIRWYMFADLL